MCVRVCVCEVVIDLGVSWLLVFSLDNTHNHQEMSSHQRGQQMMVAHSQR